MSCDPVTITRVTVEAYRTPISRTVDTSFGRMTDRPAVFLRLDCTSGCFGWGEVFANWPAAGAEHRVNLLERDIAPLVVGKTFRSPGELFHRLTGQTRIRAYQCGEEGPFQQVIAGLDMALWDLFARPRRPAAARSACSRGRVGRRQRAGLCQRDRHQAGG